MRHPQLADGDSWRVLGGVVLYEGGKDCREGGPANLKI
jgi:hypothetical protein